MPGLERKPVGPLSLRIYRIVRQSNDADPATGKRSVGRHVGLPDRGTDWKNEYDRPIYFVELHDGYRCGWFHKNRKQLTMQPHTLSHCAPESWQTPDDAEVVGKVVGMATYLNEPWLRFAQ